MAAARSRTRRCGHDRRARRRSRRHRGGGSPRGQSPSLAPGQLFVHTICSKWQLRKWGQCQSAHQPRGHEAGTSGAHACHALERRRGATLHWAVLRPRDAPARRRRYGRRSCLGRRPLWDAASRKSGNHWQRLGPSGAGLRIALGHGRPLDPRVPGRTDRSGADFVGAHHADPRAPGARQSL